MSKKHTLHLKDGTKQVRWLDYKGRTHRIGGPALITYYATGEKAYEVWSGQDFVHRSDGPATITYNKDGSIRSVRWVLNGVVCCSFNEWVKDVRITKKKLIEFKLMYG